jgi:antitoxin (DNA-binding transcriptional repressor) of toxin-antitoxin stability system
MKNVRIAQLKSQLSAHLRLVRGGEVLTVLDRDTPVARIVPIETGDDIVIAKPAPGAPPVGRFKFPPPTKLDFDIVDYLLEDRTRR